MKTQYPCNNSENEIHVWKKHGKFQCVLPGTAMESPKNCEHFNCLGYDTKEEAFTACINYHEDVMCCIPNFFWHYVGEIK